jgi:aspartate aminotransferase-like enzyme
MTPGPVQVASDALLAQAEPMAFHRSEEVWSLYAMITHGLRRLVNHPAGELLLLPSSGTGAMEAAVVNLFSPGERVLVCCNGFFSGRFVDLCHAYGLDVIRLELPWERAVDPERVAGALRDDPSIRGVFVTFHDTATGVVNDLPAIGEALAPFEALFIVDGVSGVGASPVDVADWGIDCLVGASQKALAAPPGLAFAALSERAWARCQETTNGRFYFDLRKLKAALDAGQSPSPWTPPVSTLRALAVSLEELVVAGDDAYMRQQALATAVQAGVTALGLALYADETCRSQAVTVIEAPASITPQEITERMRLDWGVTIAEGLGPLRTTTFRVGHVGAIDLLDVVATLFALEATLARCGYPIQPGAALGAVHRTVVDGPERQPVGALAESRLPVTELA